MATSTVEDYLKCILLEQQRDPEALVSMRRISSALSVAPGRRSRSGSSAWETRAGTSSNSLKEGA